MSLLNRPLKIRVLFIFIWVLIAFVFSEMALSLSYRLLFKHSFQKSEIRTQLRTLAENEPSLNKNTTRGDYKTIDRDFSKDFSTRKMTSQIEVVHPFLGYVQDPRRNPNVSEFGFPGRINPVLKRSSDRLIVGLVGGSVAMWTYFDGRERLIEQLKRVPVWKNREIIVLNLSMGGYKQPQQLMTLAYMLSLGAQFDVILNLDGFNEVALSSVENVPKKVFPLFPRDWFFRVGNVNDPSLLIKMGELGIINQKRKTWAILLESLGFDHSAVLTVFWKGADRILESSRSRKIADIQNQSARLDEISSYVFEGPFAPPANEKDLFQFLATSWAESSLQMKNICVGNGIRYFHFLQPNQYLSGSKKMNLDEQKRAIKKDYRYRKSIETGYPVLIHQGKVLRKQNVVFTDLTMIFADTDVPLYIDECCHLSPQGNEMLATKMGQVVVNETWK